MPALDIAPLLRSTVGFDHLWRLLDQALQVDEGGSYPPYNIEKHGEDRYRIVMAVAGFRPEELEVVTEPNLLIVRGKRHEEPEVEYLHRGIAGRAFERRFQLADHVRVVDARLENGLLVIELVREIPEALKPRRIPIRSERTVEARAVESRSEVRSEVASGEESSPPSGERVEVQAA